MHTSIVQGVNLLLGPMLDTLILITPTAMEAHCSATWVGLFVSSAAAI